MSTELRVRKAVPEYDGTLRSHMIKIPTCISECSGIRVFGRRICRYSPGWEAASPGGQGC